MYIISKQFPAWKFQGRTSRLHQDQNQWTRHSQISWSQRSSGRLWNQVKIRLKTELYSSSEEDFRQSFNWSNEEDFRQRFYWSNEELRL